MFKASFDLSDKLLGLLALKSQKLFWGELSWLVRLSIFIPYINSLNMTFYVCIDLNLLDFTGELIMIPLLCGMMPFSLLLQSRISAFDRKLFRYWLFLFYMFSLMLIIVIWRLWLLLVRRRLVIWKRWLGENSWLILVLENDRLVV